MPQEILHLISSLSPGSAAGQLSLLTRGLDTRFAGEFLCEVVSLASGRPANHVAGISTSSARSLGLRFSPDPILMGRLVLLLRRHRNAIVHAWDATSARYAAFALCFCNSASLVVSDLRGECVGLPGKLGSAHRVILTREANRERARAHGWPDSKLNVIPPGVPQAQPVQDNREQVLEELLLPTDAMLVGVVGRLTLANRVRQLIWAFDLVRVLRDNARMIIIGDGPEFKNLQRFADRASTLEHVRFLGERQDVFRLLPHFATLWHGGISDHYPSSVMEAMAASVPVVAVESGTNRELIECGKSGLLVPLDDRAGRARATDELLGNSELRARIGKAGRQLVFERFAIDNMVEAYANLYRKIASEH